MSVPESTPESRPRTDVPPRRDTTSAVVAVDLGGTRLRTGLFDRQGNLLRRRAVATPGAAGPEAVIAEIARQVRAVTADGGVPITGLAVSCLGPVDPARGVVRDAPTIAGFDDVPVGPLLSERLGLPVGVINDANAAALAEWHRGSGVGLDDFCYVTVSTGVGCGIISGGRLVTGAAGGAGELGRLRRATGVRLEDEVSGTAVGRRARELTGDPAATAETVATAAAAGDRRARAVLGDAGATLGHALADLVRLLGPERIALGGGLSRSGAPFWDPMRTALRASLAEDATPPPPVVEAQLGDDAGLHGAALWYLDRSTSTPPSPISATPPTATSPTATSPTATRSQPWPA